MNISIYLFSKFVCLLVFINTDDLFLPINAD
jgi:hypothetical protein